MLLVCRVFGLSYDVIVLHSEVMAGVRLLCLTLPHQGSRPFNHPSILLFFESYVNFRLIAWFKFHIFFYYFNNPIVPNTMS